MGFKINIVYYLWFMCAKRKTCEKWTFKYWCLKCDRRCTLKIVEQTIWKRLWVTNWFYVSSNFGIHVIAILAIWGVRRARRAQPPTQLIISHFGQRYGFVLQNLIQILLRLGMQSKFRLFFGFNMKFVSDFFHLIEI